MCLDVRCCCRNDCQPILASSAMESCSVGYESLALLSVCKLRINRLPTFSLSVPRASTARADGCKYVRSGTLENVFKSEELLPSDNIVQLTTGILRNSLVVLKESAVPGYSIAIIIIIYSKRVGGRLYSPLNYERFGSIYALHIQFIRIPCPQPD